MSDLAATTPSLFAQNFWFRKIHAHIKLMRPFAWLWFDALPVAVLYALFNPINFSVLNLFGLIVLCILIDAGATTLRVVKVHPSSPLSSMDFNWPGRLNNLTYQTSPLQMFWGSGPYWCTGDGASCKNHGGLNNGWDISNSTTANQWVTYYPADFFHATPSDSEVSYNQGGVAWIYLWAR